MQEKRYNDAKKEIRSVLLTYKSSVTLEEFHKSYKNLVGERLPYRALGFSSDVECLQSMPDAVNVCTDLYGKVLLTGIADETSEHIQKLVSKQRISQPRNSKSNKSCQRQRMPDTFPLIKEQPYSKLNKSNERRKILETAPMMKEQQFLPGTLRAEILRVMDMYQYGVGFSAFVIAYHRKFNKYLPLDRGLESLEGMISLIPELEVRSINNEKMICFTNSDIGNNHLKISVPGKYISPTGHTKDKDYKKVLLTDSNSPKIHKSGITEEVLQDFELLLQKCPEGIADVYFPPLYENLTKKNFDLLELGYTSVIDLVDALPHIFRRILNPDGEKNWMILPAKANKKNFLTDGNSTKSQKGIPSDAASPSLQFMGPAIPQNLDLNEYLPVFVSAIINPSMFWFQLQIEDTVKEFENFEKDMGYFYDYHAGSKYIMQDADITIGATCIVCYPKGKQWYRAMIKSIPNVKVVNVLFVDYGSRENVPRSNLYYVRSKYHDYPAYAFKAQLAGVKPPKDAMTWDFKAQQRFIELCNSTSLMAFLNSGDKDTLSAHLCDTGGDSDIHLSDTLVNEGFAERCFENQYNFQDSFLSNGKIEVKDPLLNRISSDTESCFSSESVEHRQHLTRSLGRNSSSSIESFNVKQKLIFSPKEKANGVKSNISEQVQEPKRFVKQVYLCQDCKIHVINLENKLFMTCGELSRLLWWEKDSSFLIERLRCKEVDVPFLRLSKESYAPLFEQCIYYKIPEYQTLKSSNSSLILYPLQSGFNILNVFGHPSVCLRLAIKNEIASFNPSDQIWKEFNYNELNDLSDIDKEVENQLSKLCLYDLKAKKEALMIKRMKLLRIGNASATEEIKNIENLQNVLTRRIKKIESISSEYLSCS